MVIITRGPIHIIALIEDTSPMQIMAPTMRPPMSPKMIAAGDAGDVELPGQLVDRRGVQEHRVERDIQHQHDQRSRQQRARQVLLRRRASRR